MKISIPTEQSQYKYVKNRSIYELEPKPNNKAKK
jgi:hypothetical protein